MTSAFFGMAWHVHHLHLCDVIHECSLSNSDQLTLPDPNLLHRSNNWPNHWKRWDLWNKKHLNWNTDVKLILTDYNWYFQHTEKLQRENLNIFTIWKVLQNDWMISKWPNWSLKPLKASFKGLFRTNLWELNFLRTEILQDLF